MLLFWFTSIYVVVFVYQYICCFCLPEYLLFWFTSIYVVFVYQYICCCFGLPVRLMFVLFTSESMLLILFTRKFCLPVNFAITERESRHVMVVSENETWIWRRRIVTMPLPLGF